MTCKHKDNCPFYEEESNPYIEEGWEKWIPEEGSFTPYDKTNDYYPYYAKSNE